MRIYDNGTYRDMTEEEVLEWEKQANEAPTIQPEIDIEALLAMYLAQRG